MRLTVTCAACGAQISTRQISEAAAWDRDHQANACPAPAKAVS